VASDISYNLLEVNWLHTEWDVVGLDSSDGVGLNLSYSPVQSLYITAGGSWQQVDTARDSADLWTANVGLGGYIPLTSNIHFVTEVGAAFYASMSVRTSVAAGATSKHTPALPGPTPTSPTSGLALAVSTSESLRTGTSPPASAPGRTRPR
jgi:hypothetical protein